MAMQRYEEAARLMQRYPDLMDFSGPCTEELINDTEVKLNVKFPSTYRKFLADYGAGSFASSEIYGIVKKNPDAMMIPNVLGATLSARQDYNLPEYLILISELGNGAVYCLDCSEIGESPVVVYWSTFPTEVQTYKIEAENFAEYFFAEVKLAIEIETEDGAIMPT